MAKELCTKQLKDFIFDAVLCEAHHRTGDHTTGKFYFEAAEEIAQRIRENWHFYYSDTVECKAFKEHYEIIQKCYPNESPAKQSECPSLSSRECTSSSSANSDTGNEDQIEIGINVSKKRMRNLIAKLNEDNLSDEREEFTEFYNKSKDKSQFIKNLIECAEEQGKCKRILATICRDISEQENGIEHFNSFRCKLTDECRKHFHSLHPTVPISNPLFMGNRSALKQLEKKAEHFHRFIAHLYCNVLISFDLVSDFIGYFLNIASSQLKNRQNGKYCGGELYIKSAIWQIEDLCENYVARHPMDSDPLDLVIHRLSELVFSSDNFSGEIRKLLENLATSYEQIKVKLAIPSERIELPSPCSSEKQNKNGGKRKMAENIQTENGHEETNTPSKKADKSCNGPFIQLGEIRDFHL